MRRVWRQAKRRIFWTIARRDIDDPSWGGWLVGGRGWIRGHETTTIDDAHENRSRIDEQAPRNESERVVGTCAPAALRQGACSNFTTSTRRAIEASMRVTQGRAGTTTRTTTMTQLTDDDDGKRNRGAHQDDGEGEGGEALSGHSKRRPARACVRACVGISHGPASAMGGHALLCMRMCAFCVCLFVCLSCRVVMMCALWDDDGGETAKMAGMLPFACCCFALRVVSARCFCVARCSRRLRVVFVRNRRPRVSVVREGVLQWN